MSTREFTWTPLSFINDAADKLGFGQLLSHFWFITVCCCFCICWFHFSSCFCFFILCWLGAPKNYPLPLLQNMFFSCLGMSENEVTFFRFNVTILGSKKDTSCWDIPICSYIVLDMCFVASMLCWLAPSKTDWNLQIHFSTKGFTLAQKITSDPHISKESDIHHSQNNEETFKKIFAKKTCNSKIPKETNMEKDCVFSLNCWKYSLVKEKQSLKQDSF